MKSKKLFRCRMPHFRPFLVPISPFTITMFASFKALLSTVSLINHSTAWPQSALPSSPRYRSRIIHYAGNDYSASSRKQHCHTRCKQHHRPGLPCQHPPSEQSVRPRIQRAERANVAESHGTRKMTGLRRLCACTGDRGNRGNRGRRRGEEGYLQQGP